MRTVSPEIDTAELPDPDRFMRPEHLSKLVPSRLSASRSLVHLMSAQRWEIERIRFDIDDSARGEAVYRVRTPRMNFDFMVFSFEPKLEGRTGRIIGTDWDMMGALVEGEVGPDELRITREELPKLYAGRASPGTLVWCRSNRSLRLFEHVIERLSTGNQPSVEELAGVGYLMRNTGLDGNGTFGTRSFLALEDDHPLRVPYHAQMLAAYLMREFAVDLVEHLARAAHPEAARLDPELKRFLGLGNGSALGLVFFANTHPALLDRWLTLRAAAVARARRIPAVPGTADWDRARELLGRAITFYAQDSFTYHDFTPASRIADGLRCLDERFTELEHAGHTEGFGALVSGLGTRLLPDAAEVFDAILLELRPAEVDALLSAQPVDEELHHDPCAPVAELTELLRTEYGWAWEFDMADPAQRRYRWYKSRDAEEPRRGPVDEVPGGFEWALDLPGDVRRLAGKLAATEETALVGEFLAAHPEERGVVQRVQGLAGRRYHSPRMNMLAEDFVPVHIVRLMNAAFHGLDKTVDAFGRSVLGLLFHGAPTREDLRTGAANDWIYPALPSGG
ncbi:hypothetical protein [Sciscionella sediminilitoris]|uniref:hypothetical protein n=1 Tax=Sciscionella sediminilitoris TaxID=1445613 RepID=UPI0006904C33|nr:hypothetical protein [Sciscionella sp. SE31]